MADDREDTARERPDEPAEGDRSEEGQGGRSAEPTGRDEAAEPGGPRRPRRKPMSVRDAVGPPGLRGQKPRPRKAPGARPRPEPGSGTGPGERGSGGGPPTPVREAMDAPALDEVLADPAELPSRALEVEGERWIAREGGRTRTGQRGDAGVPLLHVLFYRDEAPERAVREALVVGRALERMDEAQLARAFEGSRPIPDEERPSVSK